jgi:hypothetical protein
MLKMDPKSFQDFIQKVQNNSYNLIYIISPSKEMNDTFLKEAIDNLSAASRIDRLVGNDSTSALITNSSFSEKIPKVYISKDPVDITTSFDFFINRFTYIFMHNHVFNFPPAPSSVASGNSRMLGKFFALQTDTINRKSTKCTILVSNIIDTSPLISNMTNYLCNGIFSLSKKDGIIYLKAEKDRFAKF